MNESFLTSVIITCGKKVLSSAPCDFAKLVDCRHDEADTRMSTHASDGAQRGMKKIVIRTVEKDVVVLGVSLALLIGCEGLFFAFDTASTYLYLDAIAVAQALGENKYMALPAFHALPG